MDDCSRDSNRCLPTKGLCVDKNLSKAEWKKVSKVFLTVRLPSARDMPRHIVILQLGLQNSAFLKCIRLQIHVVKAFHDTSSPDDLLENTKLLQLVF